MCWAMPDLAPIACGPRVLRFDHKPLLMGVVNVTPDSFSDGGRFLEPAAAVSHGLALVAAGADLLDVGGESSRPGAAPVPLEEELRRVVPVVESLSRYAAVPLSVDTTKAQVAKAALAAGASIVNDISGLRFDPELGREAARAGAALVLMHMRGTPADMQQGEIAYRDVVAEVRDFLAEAVSRAEAAGVPRARVLVDPGLGFGKTVRHNLALLAGLPALAALGQPLVVGPSRKSFIGSLLDKPVGERLWGTAAAVAAAVLGGAQVIRVHDAREMRQVADLAWAIRREKENG
jgi:dihydropteroate synthase